MCRHNMLIREFPIRDILIACVDFNCNINRCFAFQILMSNQRWKINDVKFITSYIHGYESQKKFQKKCLFMTVGEIKFLSLINLKGWNK